VQNLRFYLRPLQELSINGKLNNDMLICSLCQKGMKKVAWSRHKKGSSGAGGTWALRAQIHKRTQRPNLHTYRGIKLCTKCLRMVKAASDKGRDLLAEQFSPAA